MFNIEEIFNNAIQFAKEICDILDNDISIIMHARKIHYCLVMNNHGLKRTVTKILMYQWVARWGRNMSS